MSLDQLSPDQKSQRVRLLLFRSEKNRSKKFWHPPPTFPFNAFIVDVFADYDVFYDDDVRSGGVQVVKTKGLARH